MKPRPFKSTEWISPRASGAYPPQFPTGPVSGVYAIRNRKTKRVFYVGESHTGRLRKTLGRHLSQWLEEGEPREYYDRSEIEVAWYATPAREALDHESYLIQHYRPRDNTKGMDFDQAPTNRTPIGELPDWVEAPDIAPEWCETCEPTDGIPF